jgi:hypothetical protein
MSCARACTTRPSVHASPPALLVRLRGRLTPSSMGPEGAAVAGWAAHTEAPAGRHAKPADAEDHLLAARGPEREVPEPPQQASDPVARQSLSPVARKAARSSVCCALHTPVESLQHQLCACLLTQGLHQPVPAGGALCDGPRHAGPRHPGAHQRQPAGGQRAACPGLWVIWNESPELRCLYVPEPAMMLTVSAC